MSNDERIERINRLRTCLMPVLPQICFYLIKALSTSEKHRIFTGYFIPPDVLKACSKLIELE